MDALLQQQAAIGPELAGGDDGESLFGSLVEGMALDADEEPAVDVVEKLGADYFVVSTDYPHPDGAFPEAMKEFLALPLDDAARRKILWDNCARLYDIPKPAAPLTRAAPAAAAAQ